VSHVTLRGCCQLAVVPMLCREGLAPEDPWPAVQLSGWEGGGRERAHAHVAVYGMSRQHCDPAACCPLVRGSTSTCEGWLEAQVPPSAVPAPRIIPGSFPVVLANLETEHVFTWRTWLCHSAGMGRGRVPLSPSTPCMPPWMTFWARNPLLTHGVMTRDSVTRAPFPLPPAPPSPNPSAQCC
jgi:hypothetical protein